MSEDRRISKTLSFWLRHDPAAGSLTLDASGWTDVSQVLGALARAGLPHGTEDIARVVETNDKKRFELSADQTRIRARQGHSVEIDLEWPVQMPPEHLFHGTVERFLDSIMREGLKPMQRHHVHLSPDIVTAEVVGSRRGKPVILRIAAAKLHETGQEFRLSSNRVWLTSHVPPSFFAVLASSDIRG